jgi:hypothetical protein
MKTIVVGSEGLGDDEFVQALEACTLPASCFRHGDHLRFAWLCVHAEPVDGAVDRVRRTIRGYARHLGKPELYHETITAGWVRLIASHTEGSFAEFLAVNEARLGKDLLHRFWSPEVLASERAKREWVEPDRGRLPAAVDR